MGVKKKKEGLMSTGEYKIIEKSRDTVSSLVLPPPSVNILMTQREKKEQEPPAGIKKVSVPPQSLLPPFSNPLKTCQNRR
jgi:hypothetical protein